MTWYDIDDILYDGTKKEMDKVLCPDCSSKISYRYSDNPRGFEVRCAGCGYLSRSMGGDRPNCVDIFGNEYDWSEI